jgi:outer membrane protein TolC
VEAVAAKTDGPGALEHDDRALERPLRLRTLEALVLRRHPRLVAAAHRVRALAERAHAEGSLPAPELMAEIWQIPFTKPYALDKAGMMMFAVKQTIPAPGSLDRMAEARALEVQAEAAKVAGEARGLVREVDRAFADYLEATARHAAHEAHRAVVDEMVAVARIRFTTGAGLSDIARAELERARTDADLVREHGMTEQAQARLNGLLSRAADAPLGPPEPDAPQSVALSPTEVVERANARSPDITAAACMEQSAEALALAADREARMPEFSVGVLTFLPVDNTPAGYGASFSMSLPWLWGPGSSRLASAEFRVRAERASVETMRLRVHTDAALALATVRAAERRYLVLRDIAAPAASRAVEATRAGYASGGTELFAWLDAARSSLDVEMELATARADLERALADLDYATGDRAPRTPLAEYHDHAHGQ